MEENQEQQPANNQQSTPTEVSQQSQVAKPPSPSGKPKSKKGLMFAVLVALILFILATAYFFFQNKTIPEQTPTDKETAQEVEIESAEGFSPEVEEYYKTAGSEITADWTTYTNTRYNYQVKFPKGWIYNRGPGEVGDETLSQQRNIDSYDPEAEIPGTHFMLDTNEFDADGESKNCTDLVGCANKAIESFSSLSPDIPELTDDELLENEAKSLYFARTTDSYSQSWYHLFVILDEDFYHFSAYSNTENFDDVKPVFDEILSTFEFVE